MNQYLSLSILFYFKIIYCEELISPCPKLFKYEPMNPNEPDRWYGQLTLLSDSELSGVWLRVIFDKPSLQLGNWFGQVVTEDSKDYLIKNRNHKLKKDIPETLRFYIKFDKRKGVPQLISFRLNAKTVCPEGGLVTEPPTTTGELLTSNVISTTPSPDIPQAPSVPVSQPQPEIGNNFYYPGTGGYSMNPSSDEDDDFFGSDFSYFFKRKKTTLPENTCGTVIKQPRPLITHGLETNEGEYPWHVALYHARGIDLTYICGASLITKYHLLTVAHCVTKRRTKGVLSPSSLVVYLGKFYLRVWSNTGIQNKHVEKIFVHPTYNSQRFSDDIAILKMKSPAEITDFVRPICIWEGSTSLDPVIGKIGTVVGWGFDETGKVTEELTKANMPVVSSQTCIYSFPAFYSRFTTEKTFCAGFKNGTSVCNGDSGGGMVFPKSSSDHNNPVWQIRGLVSISVALQNQFRCDSSHYVVFTDVAKYLNWIKATTTLENN